MIDISIAGPIVAFLVAVLLAWKYYQHRLEERLEIQMAEEIKIFRAELKGYYEAR